MSLIKTRTLEMRKSMTIVKHLRFNYKRTLKMTDCKIEAPISYGMDRRLSHETIENIIRQKQEYLSFKREQDEVIWSDPDFRPGPLLDRIADRIALEMIKEATDFLEKTCDDFIDCLVQSEFFPDE